MQFLQLITKIRAFQFFVVIQQVDQFVQWTVHTAFRSDLMRSFMLLSQNYQLYKFHMSNNSNSITQREIKLINNNKMSEPEVVVKIIPPNPFTNSIIIAYCYVQNKSVPCQSVWSRLQSNQISLLNKSPQQHSSQGSTYKCSPLDYNNYIEVSVTCDYNGRKIQRKVKTQLVKMNRQLIQQRNRITNVNCKIYNTNIFVQCRMKLQINGILELFSGQRVFNLLLARQSCYIQSQTSFKAAIISHRYEFLTFLIQANQMRTTAKQSQILQSSSNLFDLQFQNQIERDLVLLHICEPKQEPFQMNKKIDKSQFSDQNKNYDNTSAEKTKRSFKEIQYKSKRVEQNKNFQTKNGTPQNSQSKYNIQNYDQDFNSKKKVQKIKISERLHMKDYANFISQSNIQNQFNFQKNIIKNQKNISKTPTNQNKDFLNIFQEELNNNQHVKTQPNLPNGGISSPSKPKSKIRNQQNGQAQDLPSINLRGSFEELQKSFSNIAEVKHQPRQDSRDINKQKKSVIRDYSYEYHKNKGSKYNIQRSFDSYKNSTLIELGQLKKQNAILKKQVQMLPLLTKQNNSLKKKYYQLNQEVNRLQAQKKQILTDKLKFQAHFNKQRLQKQQLKQQLEIVKNLMNKKNNQQCIPDSSKNSSTNSGFYLNNGANNLSTFGSRDGNKFTSSAGFNNNQPTNGFLHSFRNNNQSPSYGRVYVNQYGKQYTIDRMNKQ